MLSVNKTLSMELMETSRTERDQTQYIVLIHFPLGHLRRGFSGGGGGGGHTP
jgi:hypothetical protein